MLQPCQQTMLSTRRDFPCGTRVYECEAAKVACKVEGPGTDEEMVELVCRECCEMEKALVLP